jgi:DNA-binding NarL/FixJ family response regulator
MVARTKLRVLLADDHALVREGLRRVIDDQADMEVIGEAGDGTAAVALAQELAPDVALVDVSMPGLDGTEVTRIITDTCPGVRVIALTRHKDGSFVERLLDAGAAGYVLKQSPSSELTRAIRAVAAGERYIDTSIREAPPSPHLESPAPPRPEAALTTEEERVLGMIALGHSHRDVAHQLSIELPQVLAIRAAAMSKAGLRTRAAITRYAQARGWLGTG